MVSSSQSTFRLKGDSSGMPGLVCNCIKPHPMRAERPPHRSQLEFPRDGNFAQLPERGAELQSVGDYWTPAFAGMTKDVDGLDKPGHDDVVALVLDCGLSFSQGGKPC